MNRPDRNVCTCGHDMQDHKAKGYVKTPRTNTECLGPYCDCMKYIFEKIA